MTNTFTMWGNSTGYGAVYGTESFVLNGYMNTVLLEGADDTVSIAAGGDDSINLNATGFTNNVTDVIDLGQGLLNSISAASALYGANVSISGGYGANDISLVNHWGTTVLALGNAGASVNHPGLGLNDNITLNGDATNEVSFTSGDGADIAIGVAGDGFTNDTSSVALFGVYDQLTGGDEAFTVTGASGLASIALGNGNSTLTLGGAENTVSLGTGNDNVTFLDGFDTLSFGAGGAGSTDIIDFARFGNSISGGNENFNIAATNGSVHGTLGDGNDSITAGHGYLTLGAGATNTATNSIDLTQGHDGVILNGGVDRLTLQDVHGGHDNVTLNGTMLGTQLTAGGSFDDIVLKADANAAISEVGGAQGLGLIVMGDATFGTGNISVTGLAQDDLAHITLIGISAFTETVDDTPAGGITLNFAHGSLDLIGVQAISNSLITTVSVH